MKTKIIVFLVLGICLLVFPSFLNPSTCGERPFIIVLDAGHGGIDPGNTGNGFKEKDIALKIVLEIGRILEKEPNIKVIYTRKTDVSVALGDRAPIANKADADLFVSVHCNSHHTQAYGTETFVLGLHMNQANFEVAKKENEVIFLEENYEEKYEGFDPSSPESFIGMTLMQEEYLDQSILLAGLIQNNFFTNLKRKNRSVKQAGFMVLYKSYMPSVLIETGFLTHKKEGAYLNSKKGQREMAAEIAKGIISYKNNLSLATDNSKNPVIDEKEETENNLDTSEEKIYDHTVFKVQLAAGSRRIKTKPSNFKGLKEVSRNKEDGLYKYYYGETSDYNKIKLMKTFAREKGYSSCFIVAFQNGVKVKLSEILKSEDQ